MPPLGAAQSTRGRYVADIFMTSSRKGAARFRLPRGRHRGCRVVLTNSYRTSNTRKPRVQE